MKKRATTDLSDLDKAPPNGFVRLVLTVEEYRALRRWLKGRQQDIESDWEDLGELEPLLVLLEDEWP